MTKEGITRRTSLGVIAGPAFAGSVQEASPVEAPYLKTRSALERLRDLGASVKDTGATGDGLADDTDALQEIATYFGTRGGEWRIPAGTYRISAAIAIDCRMPQRVVGRGRRGVYPPAFIPGGDTGLAVILPVHTGRQAIEFVGKSAADGSIEIRDLALATLEAGPVPVSAFGWDAGRTFQRNFSFIGCSVHGFTSAFDVYRNRGAGTQVGLFRAHYCTINRNQWIARTMDGTQWNGFDFSFNEAGQNGYLPKQGGIDISAHNVLILGNCLEGMRDPIRIHGAYRGVDIRSNYFESNVGAALIQLNAVRGPWEIGPQTHVDIDYRKLDHQLLVAACGPGRSAVPYRAEGVHKTPMAVIGNDASARDNIENPDAGSVVNGWLRCDAPCAQFLQEPEIVSIARQRVVIGARDVHPITGRAMPVEEYATSGVGDFALSYSLTGEVGHWVVISWLMKREGQGAPANPQIIFNINGRNAPGSRSYLTTDFDAWWQQGEWCLLTAAIQLGTAMTSLALTLLPYGASPAVGRKIRFLRPAVYTTDSVNKIAPYVDPFIAHSVTAAPSRGAWLCGDTLANAVPSAGQTAFFCTADGTPGVWIHG